VSTTNDAESTAVRWTAGPRPGPGSGARNVVRSVMTTTIVTAATVVMRIHPTVVWP
jgi:hypothetical protein